MTTLCEAPLFISHRSTSRLHGVTQMNRWADAWGNSGVWSSSSTIPEQQQDPELLEQTYSR